MEAKKYTLAVVKSRGLFDNMLGFGLLKKLKQLKVKSMLLQILH